VFDGLFRSVAVKKIDTGAAVLAASVGRCRPGGATGAFDLLHAYGELGAFRLRQFTYELLARKQKRGGAVRARLGID
jgi:hypothetical protein